MPLLHLSMILNNSLLVSWFCRIATARAHCQIERCTLQCLTYNNLFCMIVTRRMVSSTSLGTCSLHSVLLYLEVYILSVDCFKVLKLCCAAIWENRRTHRCATLHIFKNERNFVSRRGSSNLLNEFKESQAM